MKKIILLFCVVIAMQVSTAQNPVISSDRLVTWQGKVGVEGGIPTRTSLVNCTLPPYNAHADGNNTAAEIQACLNALTSGQVCYLPPGIYSLSSKLTIPSNVSLRGAGADSTTLLFTANLANDIQIGGNYTDGSTGAINIVSGYTKGSTQLVLQNATGITPGKFIYVSELNDPTIPVNVTNNNGTCNWCGIYGSNGQRARLQLTKVTAVNGNSVSIDPAMYFSFTASLTPQVLKAPTYTQYAGIESLTIKNAGTSLGSSTRRNLNLQGAANCWAQYVKFENLGKRGVNLWFDVFRNEIRDCYFNKVIDQFNNDNYSVEINSGSGNLIENNVFDDLANGTLMVSSSGNVIGYNYMKAVHRTSQMTTWFWPDSWTHGAHSSYNLWEGNDQTALEFDFYWGSNSHNVAFRNRFHGKDASIAYDIPNLMTAGAVLTYPQNNYMSCVANILGEPGFHNKYEETTYQAVSRPIWCTPNAAFGFTTAAAFNTMQRHMNYDYFTNTTKTCGSAGEPPCQSSATGTILPNSLYLAAKPSWFCVQTSTITYPPVGPDVSNGIDQAGHAHKIPARVCYDNTPLDGNGNKKWNGKNCLCTTNTNTVNTSIQEAKQQNVSLNVYPNPSNGKFQIDVSGEITGFEVSNALGQVIISQRTANVHEEFSIAEPGIYILKATTPTKQVITRKIIVSK